MPQLPLLRQAFFAAIVVVTAYSAERGCALGLHRPAEAEKQYAVLSNKTPMSPGALKGLALSRLAISNQALVALKAAAPHSSALYDLAGVAAAESGDRNGAAKLFQKVLDTPPEAAWMRLDLSAVLGKPYSRMPGQYLRLPILQRRFAVAGIRGLADPRPGSSLLDHPHLR